MSVDIKKIFLGLRSLGLRGSLRVLSNTQQKSRLDRIFWRQRQGGEAHGPGVLQSVDKTAQGARLRFERVELEIVFLAPDLARLTWGLGTPPVPYALAEANWKAVSVSVKNEPGSVELSAPGLLIRVDPQGSVEYCTPSGVTLRKENPPQRLAKDGRTLRWVHRAALQLGEKVYGLGEQAASLDLAAQQRTYHLWNSDPGGSYAPGSDPLYIGIPVFTGLHSGGSYLVFYENPYRGSLTFSDPKGPERTVETIFDGGQLRIYFAAGSPQQVLQRFTTLTGRPPLPPRWALGYHQSRWGYKSEAEIRQVVVGFEEHHLPLSAIHLDIDYMNGFRVFTVDEERFPNLESLASDLAEKGVRLVAIVDPGVKQDPQYEIYRQGVEGNHFCTLPDGELAAGVVWPGWSVFPDFTRPATRLWWGDLYARLLEQGIAGFWIDINEPASFSVSGDMTLPLSTRFDLEGRGGGHLEAHNLYGLLMASATYEGLRRQQPEKRPWVLTRSGWAGLQRYAWNWTGDIETSWRMLRQTVCTVLGLSLSGLYFCGPDIGGFSGEPDAELFTRWFELGAFLPFFRTHSSLGIAPREPWAFGEPTTSTARRYLELRSQMLPYWYTLAWEASQTGAPLVRPLFWPDASEQELWDVQDAFFLGDALLIAPVVEKGAEQRPVRLPAGEWFNFWEDTPYSGPAEVHLPAPLNRLPLLVRAGSILPFEEDRELTLHAYPDTGGHAAGRLYSDAGDGYGLYRLDEFDLRIQGADARLEWNSQGDYPWPYKAAWLNLHGSGVVQRVEITPGQQNHFSLRGE